MQCSSYCWCSYSTHVKYNKNNQQKHFTVLVVMTMTKVTMMMMMMMMMKFVILKVIFQQIVDDTGSTYRCPNWRLTSAPDAKPYIPGGKTIPIQASSATLRYRNRKWVWANFSFSGSRRHLSKHLLDSSLRNFGLTTPFHLVLCRGIIEFTLSSAAFGALKMYAAAVALAFGLSIPLGDTQLCRSPL
ncbi:uncharacterized protein LOC119631651 isoform X2 [Glossina fuscipes]|uniref:Uncharacterized protein LOC119631651 isoform X2 n=1 Tax=Glossina fuscipes TaxID=7396 RepID=A0A8U0W475_9MUSC|nr:uncharacterized protein LOC119631651 isoform X2 [Glossina fuscipes]